MKSINNSIGYPLIHSHSQKEERKKNQKKKEEKQLL
jgi:hypothetical protein